MSKLFRICYLSNIHRKLGKETTLLRQLIFPIVLLIAISYLSFSYVNLINYIFGLQLSEHLQSILTPLFQVSVWIMGAWFINRCVCLFVWERLSPQNAGETVPKLLKDIVALIIFFITLLIIISVVFDKSITGIWATSGAIGIVLGFALQNIILDTFTGIAINLDKPYRTRGGWIQSQFIY